MSAPSTVLLLSSDPLLEYAVEHVLPGSTYQLRRAESFDQAGAADLLPQLQPRAILVDLPDVSEPSVEFVRWLHATAGVPVLVLAREPAALGGEFEPAIRVLPRTCPPGQLQAVLHDLLAEPAPAAPPPPSRTRKVVTTALWLVIVGTGLLLILPLLGVPHLPNILKLFVGRAPAAEQPPETPVTLLPQPGKQHLWQSNLFLLDDETYRQLKIPPPYTVQTEPDKRQIVLSGSLAFDPDKLGRVQSQFPGRVVEIGEVKPDVRDPRPGGTARDREPLKYGSKVKEGDLMAVVWSTALGTAKSDLIDARVKLHLDEENLARWQKLAERGSLSESQLRDAKNKVSADLSAIARARRTLRTWRVSEEEIKAIEREAEEIINSKTLRALNRMKDNTARWAKVEVRAPFDGVVVEKNVTVGQNVETATDLFKIADLSRLAVFANAYEEDQRILQQLQHRFDPLPVPWRVHLTSDPQKTPLPSRGIYRIGYIVDPTQKTNLAIGRVDNADGNLRIGQSVTALVDVPPPPDVVSVPASALVEDGETSVLFVQLDAKQHSYAMKHVSVVERFNGHAYIRSRLTGKQKSAGLQELHPGERVVIGGAIELKAALEEVQARARREQEQRQKEEGKGRG